MKKLIKCLKSKAILRIAMFATLFVLLDTLIEMNKKTEEQVTYSITLENLAHGQNGETNGETGGAGGGADGETRDGGTGEQPKPCSTTINIEITSSITCGGKTLPSIQVYTYVCERNELNTCSEGTIDLSIFYNSECKVSGTSGSTNNFKTLYCENNH